MRAVILQGFGGPEVMKIGDAPMPTVRECDVLVRVKATGVNRAELLQRQGKYPPPPGASSILGLEFAGEVATAAHSWPAGARVMGILTGGGYAEYVAVHHSHLIRIPDSMTFETAAAIPEVWLTAYQLTHFVGCLKLTARVLIHAAASGVGTALIQLVRDAGAVPLATCGSPAKVATCIECNPGRLGAAAVDYHTEDFSAWVQPGKADLILDPVLGSYFQQNIDSLNADGKWVIYGTLGGTTVERVNIGPLLAKRANIEFTTLKSRTDEYKAELVRRFVSDGVVEKLASGVLRPIIHSVMSWTEVQEAHRIMETSENIGKIVIRID